MATGRARATDEWRGDLGVLSCRYRHNVRTLDRVWDQEFRSADALHNVKWLASLLLPRPLPSGMLQSLAAVATGRKGTR